MLMVRIVFRELHSISLISRVPHELVTMFRFPELDHRIVQPEGWVSNLNDNCHDVRRRVNAQRLQPFSKLCDYRESAVQSVYCDRAIIELPLLIPRDADPLCVSIRKASAFTVIAAFFKPCMWPCHA